MGSEMALHLYLKKIGKSSRVLNTHATPSKFSLVDPRGEIEVYKAGSEVSPADVIFVLDTNDVNLLGALKKPLLAMKAPLIFVDHHVPEVEDLDNHLIDEQYAATGELTYEFLRHMRADIDSEIAMALYVSIVTDTGSFRFKRTTPRSHLIAAELLQKGVSPEVVFQHIFASNSIGKMKLLGELLRNIQTSSDGKVAWVTIPLELRKRYGASVEDTEAFINQVTLIEDLDVALMFREDEGGVVKVSMRGMGPVPVVGIAKKFGGGGHRHAAGMKVKMTLEDAVKKVCAEVESLLS